MPRGPERRDELLEQMKQPTYEDDVRATAVWLRRKAERGARVEISAHYACWIANRLENHADDVERSKG